MRGRLAYSILMIASTIVATTSPSIANIPRGDATTETPFRLMLGARVIEPFAEAIFCHRNPGECLEGMSAEIEYTPSLLDRLAATNAYVNRTIVPKLDDPDVMGGNVWQLAPAEGDCKDYAITKRHRLIAAGLPSGALRLAIVHTRAGEAHMVLVVSTTKGDLILDNLTGAILPVAQTDYDWEKMQSSANPRQWFAVTGTAPLPAQLPPRDVPPFPADRPTWAQLTLPAYQPLASRAVAALNVV